MPWDFGGVPPDLRTWLATPRGPMRVLIPGCGSAHELRYFAELGHAVTAIDFSDVALQARPVAEQRAVEALLAEQRRTNRLLQGIVYGGIGFVLGLLAMQVLVRWH